METELRKIFICIMLLPFISCLGFSKRSPCEKNCSQINNQCSRGCQVLRPRNDMLIDRPSRISEDIYIYDNDNFDECIDNCEKHYRRCLKDCKSKTSIKIHIQNE